MPSSSPAPDGQHSGEDTGTGRCVYLPETKRCAVADGNALEQVVHSDTTVTLQRSLRCRESSFSLNIAHRGLFVDLELDDTNLAIRFFFFPVDYLTFFTLICGLQGLALPIYLNCVLDSWRLLIMWLIKT